MLSFLQLSFSSLSFPEAQTQVSESTLMNNVEISQSAAAAATTSQILSFFIFKRCHSAGLLTVTF